MQFVKGDVLACEADVVLHQVNCLGVMGAGVAKQVREKYPVVFKVYKALCDANSHCRQRLLGYAQFVRVDGNRCIVNLFAQDR